MKSLFNWDPFRELDDVTSILRLPFKTGTLEKIDKNEWAPAVDIAEDDTAYTITADLPDVKKEDVHVTFENGTVTISGERRHESEEKDEKKKYHRIERKYGSYRRSFSVPEHVDAERIAANFKEGVLNVTLPKVPGQDEPAKIEVPVG